MHQDIIRITVLSFNVGTRSRLGWKKILFPQKQRWTTSELRQAESFDLLMVTLIPRSASLIGQPCQRHFARNRHVAKKKAMLTLCEFTLLNVFRDSLGLLLHLEIYFSATLSDLRCSNARRRLSERLRFRAWERTDS